jgi:hypothetical protein
MRKWLAETIGWYGTTAVLGAFALLSFEVIGASSALFQWLNASGAAAIVFISYRKKAYEPATLNIVWCCIALISLARML